MTDSSAPPKTYILGHDDRELKRLSTQARLVDRGVRVERSDQGGAAAAQFLSCHTSSSLF